MNHLKRNIFRLLCIATVLCLFSPVYGAKLELDDEQLNRYAMHLYRNGEYYRAVTEYKRLLHFFPKSSYNNDARIQIGRSFMAGGRTEVAIKYWKFRLDRAITDDRTQNRYKMLYGISLLDLNRTDPFRLRNENITSAVNLFKEVEPLDEEGRQVREFAQDWSSLPEPDRKSPLLAGSMSAIIPGSGSAYTGRYVEGVYAFFLTSLFWLATADAVRNEHATLTGVFGFFTLAFYGGSIYTAVNSAHKYNDQIQSDRLLELRKKHGIWFVPATRRRNGQF